MAKYQVMYWQDIPTQIKVVEGTDDLNIQLDPRLMELVDEKATELDMISTDAYLEAWHWGDEEEREGSAQDVATALQHELESAHLPK